MEAHGNAIDKFLAAEGSSRKYRLESQMGIDPGCEARRTRRGSYGGALVDVRTEYRVVIVNWSRFGNVAGCTRHWETPISLELSGMRGTGDRMQNIDIDRECLLGHAKRIPGPRVRLAGSEGAAGFGMRD